MMSEIGSVHPDDHTERSIFTIKNEGIIKQDEKLRT
jgi:hypothetical protein